MESEKRVLAIALAAVFMATAMFAFIPSDDVAAAESLPEGEKYKVDFGQIWSMGIQCVFDGAMAESILWDFGDGETSEEFNPQHHYEETGVYTIKQTVTNPEGTDTTYYRVEIMGYPYVTLVYNNGQENGIIQQTSGESNAVPAVKPADPTRDGFDFTGWYTDEKCTVAYDWSQKVEEPVTLYAGWVEAGTTSGDDTEDGELMYAVGAVVCGILAVVCFALAVQFNRFAIIGAVVLAVLAIVCGLFYGGLI